jgi:acyl-CoA thioester hydrolase
MPKSKRAAAEGEPFCFEYARRIQFADTDIAGITHFSVYYRYMEEAEHAFFRSLGETVHAREGVGGLGWPRLNASCDFLGPMRFENEVRIRVSIQEIGAKTVRYHHNFWLTGTAGDALVAIGSIVTICVRLDASTGQMQSVNIPGPLRAKLEAARRNPISAKP